MTRPDLEPRFATLRKDDSLSGFTGLFPSIRQNRILLRGKDECENPAHPLLSRLCLNQVPLSILDNTVIPFDPFKWSPNFDRTDFTIEFEARPFQIFGET